MDINCENIQTYRSHHILSKTTNRMRFTCTTLHRRQIAQYARREKENSSKKEKRWVSNTLDCFEEEEEEEKKGKISKNKVMYIQSIE